MSALPASRKALSGRTYSSPWDAGTVGPGAAIQRPPKSHRIADAAFGLAMAAVVCATLWVLFTYGRVPA